VVNESQQYSAAEMELVMKVQDVLLKAMANRITGWAAAERPSAHPASLLGASRRWRSEHS
jgi:hypothetical protein